MKLKSLLFVSLLALASAANADKRHVPVNAGNPDAKTAMKKVALPGACEVEIINCSPDPLVASGSVGNGGWVAPFPIDSYSFFRGCDKHIIDLRAGYGYCYTGIDLTISNSYSVVFRGYVYAPATVRIG